MRKSVANLKSHSWLFIKILLCDFWYSKLFVFNKIIPFRISINFIQFHHFLKYMWLIIPLSSAYMIIQPRARLQFAWLWSTTMPHTSVIMIRVMCVKDDAFVRNGKSMPAIRITNLGGRNERRAKREELHENRIDDRYAFQFCAARGNWNS